jgi:hypothetical protein
VKPVDFAAVVIGVVANNERGYTKKGCKPEPALRTGRLFEGYRFTCQYVDKFIKTIKTTFFKAPFL